MPFALSAGLVTASDGWHVFRLFNTNTEIFVDVGLNVVDGQEEVDGELVLPRVNGTGAPIKLMYPDPAGSRTSGLLPSGVAREDSTSTGWDSKRHSWMRLCRSSSFQRRWSRSTARNPRMPSTLKLIR